MAGDFVEMTWARETIFGIMVSVVLCTLSVCFGRSFYESI
jgi:hypothetical protein